MKCPLCDFEAARLGDGEERAVMAEHIAEHLGEPIECVGAHPVARLVAALVDRIDRLERSHYDLTHRAYEPPP